MKNPLLKKALPHIIAIVSFLLISVIFCKPVLEGNVLNQHDNVGWKGMAQNAFEYKAKHGHFPLWNPNLFSGMPNYQVAMEGKSVFPNMVNIFSLGLPKPINFFFLACILFYILCIAIRVRPIIGMLCSVAYAFSTYNPVLIAAGHDTQMLATAFMPLVMAGIIFTYEKKYWLGLALTTFGAYQLIGSSHFQVTYYFLLIAGLVTIAYLVKWIKDKDWKHILVAGAITLFSAIVGLAGNSLSYKTTSEYSKYTMRGGKQVEIKGDSVTAVQTKGLDTAYAFEYSLGKAETFTLLMPGAFGGGSYARFSEGTKVAKKLVDKGIPENNAEQVAQSLPKYWGKIFSAGPAYLGVLIFVLGVLGFVIVRSPLRWGLLAATLLGVMMTWGKYFAGFNVFLFEHLPLYNKFRSPSFAQVIPQFTMGIMAALALQKLLFEGNSREFIQENRKKILFTVGGIFVFIGLVYMAMDFSSQDDAGILAQLKNQGAPDDLSRAVISGLKSERQAMFGGQLLRALGLTLLAAFAVYAYVRKWIKPLIAAIILFVISSLDILVISYKYFNNDNDQNEPKPDSQKLYIQKDDYNTSNFAPSLIDNEILKDTSPHYRVFNTMGTTSGGPFSESRTSYYHRSVGGYHPAKLRIYQDIIEKYFSTSLNQEVLNMLDTRYLIVQSPLTGGDSLVRRDGAYGACWLVKNVQIVNGPVAALQAIGTTNLRDTAIVESSFSKDVVMPQPDSASSISLTKFDNDVIEYSANCNGPQFAVFSEVYYPVGWNAYIDGKKVNYVNADYVLRGLSIPSGQHQVKFVFEPSSVKSGNSIMFIASIIILIVFLGGLFMAWRSQTPKAESKKAI